MGWGPDRGIPGAAKNLYGTTTSTLASSPVALTMVFMYSTAGLGFWREIVVPCRFWTDSTAAIPPSRCQTPSPRQPGPQAPGHNE